METTEPMTDERFAENLLAPAEAPQNEPDEIEADEATPDEEAEPEEVEAEGEGDDADADEDEAEDADHEEPSDTFTVMVDGAPTKVTLDDLKRNFSGQAYIQKKMQEAAEARNKYQAEAQTLHQERAQLAQLIQKVQQGGLTPPTPPDEALFQTDPIGFMEQKLAYEKAAAAFSQNVEQVKAAQLQQAEQQRKAYQQFLAKQAEALTSFIPEFADPEAGGKLKAKLRDTGRNVYGFSEEEISSIADARMVRVLDDARKWQDLQASKAKAAGKARNAPPVGAGSRKRPAASNAQKNRERLRAEGSDEAFANFLLE